jgi:hypothetical protein
LSENAANWTPEEVGLWIKGIGKKFEVYVTEFEENGIDGDFLINGLTEDALSELIDKKIHRLLIWRKVLKLRQNLSADD